MKKILVILSLVPFLNSAQVVTPVAVSGFSLDAIAEATTALANTTGAIDGSNYVMYSVAYGTVFTTGTGLPNNGLISSGTRTYQLEPYNQDNTFYLAALQTGTLSLVTPASYAGISLLGFATEGGGTLDITIVFSDNTTQAYSSQALPDWFGTGNSVITGFDRCTRSSGTPNYSTTNPKMFPLDLSLTCANRSKLVSKIVVQNTNTNSRICLMAVSAAGIPSFSVSTVPVSCSGGSNGSASITPTGGFPGYTFTVNTTPAQFTGNLVNMPAGAYSYTAADVANCPVTGNFSITQSLVTQPTLSVTATAGTVCAGTSVTLTASGAASYTWTGNVNGPVNPLVPASSTLITVQGLTSQNCLRTGTFALTVNPLPQVSAVSLPNSCITQPAINMTATPGGGFFSGQGVQGSMFDPQTAGTGTHNLLYIYVDQNNCSNSATFSAAVYSLAAPAISSGMAVCMKSAAYSVTVSPQGGTFGGGPITQTGLITTTASGVFPFSYSITDGPCEASSTGAYTVLPLPALTFTLSKTQFCLTGGAVGLNANPGPGIFTGPGVNGFFFTPSGAGPGTHTIVYSHTNTAKCSNTAQIIVKVEDCSAVAETDVAGLKVYPNPSSGLFSVSTPVPQRFVVTDMLGRTITTFSTDANVVHLLDLSARKGLYFLVDPVNRLTKKLVVE